MLQPCPATPNAPVEAAHAATMTREEVDTVALNMNMCPESMLHMQQTPVKEVVGELYNHQQFKTPSANPSHLLHWQHLKTPTSSGNRHQRTPKLLSHDNNCKTPGSDSVSDTGGAIYNPFESALLERLQGPMCSPSVFAQGSTPGSAEKTPKTFRWTIDQIAILKPADIEEMPLQQALLCTNEDSGTEVEAQKAIDTFFSTHVVLPSPWTDSAKKKPFKLPRTPGAESDDDWEYPPVQAPNKSDTREISCQTTLTLPTEFDIFHVLAEHYTYQGDEGAQDLSTSSLRRKLFFQGTGTSPISPVKNGYSAAMSAEMITPDRLFRSCPPQQPPSSCLFSSSPIGSPSSHMASSSLRRTATSHLHRLSTAPDMMASPQLSPIKTSCMRRNVEPPLRAAYVSPNQDSPSQFWAHRTMESPGMSPISSACASHQKLPPVPLELQFDEDESPAPIRSDACQNLGADITLDDVHQMDLDTSLCRRDTSSCVRQTLFQNLPDERFDTDHSAHISTQDTGYHNNSLTNQDTGFQSRNNLTNHDTEMLSVTNQDTGFQSGSSSSSSLITGPIVHSDLTNQFSQLPVACEDLDPTFSEQRDDPGHAARRMSLSLDDDIIFRARKVLGKQPEDALGKTSSKSVMLNDIGKDSNQHDQLRVSDVAMAMLKRAKDDFARYFESIESGSAVSTPIAAPPSSEHLQHNYTSESSGWC